MKSTSGGRFARSSTKHHEEGQREADEIGGDHARGLLPQRRPEKDVRQNVDQEAQHHNLSGIARCTFQHCLLDAMDPMNDILIRRASALTNIASQLLAACENGYESPDNGWPTTWGQQHYLDVQQQHQWIDSHHHRR
jgi:hypothetical protein